MGLPDLAAEAGHAPGELAVLLVAQDVRWHVPRVEEVCGGEIREGRDAAAGDVDAAPGDRVHRVRDEGNIAVFGGEEG